MPTASAIETAQTFPVSSELPADVYAKVEHIVKTEDRTRSFVIRRIISEWAAKQPSSRKAK
jgi:predicted transcriptional regulator